MNNVHTHIKLSVGLLERLLRGGLYAVRRSSPQSPGRTAFTSFSLLCCFVVLLCACKVRTLDIAPLRVGYSKENLKIHTRVPSPPFLPSYLPSPPLLSPCLPLPLPPSLPSYIPLALALEVGPLKSS